MNVLLLQGPQGQFFSHLQKQLKESGHNCWRVAFNGGDLIQSRLGDTFVFRQKLSHWQQWLENICAQLEVTHIFVYGDCRIYHSQAKEVCEQHQIDYYAFEEGYLRPDYISFEKDGTNANSMITKDDIFSWQINECEKEVKPIRWGYYFWMCHAIVYYIALTLMRPYFPHYQHHRTKFAPYEAFCQVRGGVRKILYRFRQNKYWSLLKSKPFFLVPLQVSYDSQILTHSKFRSIEHFIEEVAESFSKNARVDQLLVFKHHPMDRGYHHYGKYIKSIGRKYGISNRIVYLHDFHMPKLLKLTRGVITINSTTAISAFHHGTPVKIIGRAFYNLEGLSDQQTLDEFWVSPTPPNNELYYTFRDFLQHNSQLNGNFYSDPVNTSLAVISSMPEPMLPVFVTDSITI